MNPTSDLFLAILSMDAYNRPETEGSATTVALVLPDAAANAIGNASVDAPTAQSDLHSSRRPIAGDVDCVLSRKDFLCASMRSVG
jgi:hypothetical protein